MITFEQAGRLSNDPVLAAIFKSVFTTDKLFGLLPWAKAPAGKAHTYLREGPQISAGFIAPGGSLTPAAQTALRVTANLRTIAASAQIPGNVARNLNDNFDQAQLQIQSIARALGRKLKTALITGTWPSVSFTLAGVALSSAGPYLKAGVGQLECHVAAGVKRLRIRLPEDPSYGDYSADLASGNPQGVRLTSGDGVQWIEVNITSASLPAATTIANVDVTSTSNEFDGLRSVVTNTLTGSTANGDAISFPLLRALIDSVDPAAGQPVIVAPLRTVRAIKALYDALGGTHAQQMQLPRYGFPGTYLAFDDVPILPNANLPVNETKGATATCTSIYCLTLAEPGAAPSAAPFQGAGICGLYGAGQRQETDDDPIMGVTVKIDETPRDATGKLMDAVEVAAMLDAAVASYSTVASARLFGITN